MIKGENLGKISFFSKSIVTKVEHSYNTRFFVQQIHSTEFVNRQDDREFDALSESIITFPNMQFFGGNNSKNLEK